MLWDLEARVEMLAEWPEVQQILTLALPYPELLGGPDVSPKNILKWAIGGVDVRFRISP